MAFITMEDFSGKGECIIFSKVYEKFYHYLHLESMVMIIGKADVSGETFKVLADEVYPMDTVRQKFTRSIVLSLNVNEVKENTIVALRQVMEKHQGACRCYIDAQHPDERRAARFQTTKFGVNPSDEFLEAVKQILGPNSVRISQSA